jgi:sterol desaturase/sphingolipid hydroxylase (fatty acid hydroxylase superfamily)
MTVQQLLGVNMGVLSIVIFFSLIAVELIAIKLFRAKGAVPAKDSVLSIGMGLLSDPVNALSAVITLSILSFVQPYQIQKLPLTWTMFALCFVLDDLRFYVHHRIAHRCRWVWAMHVVHHSSQNYNFPIALRQAWTKHFTGTMLLKIPLVLIGFDPVMVTFCGVLNATYQFFLHTETVDRMPRWFEYIFNTPSHHRVHHGNNPRYLDTNYAGVLIIWDRLLGTFAEEDREDRPVYGLVNNLNTFNPITILTHEYIAIAKDVAQRGLTPLQRLGYVFAPPGWSHDGSRLSSKDIKQRAGLIAAEPMPAEKAA